MVDKPVIRMSSAGKCPRTLSAEWLGFKRTEPPAWLEQTATEGNWHEDRIVKELFEDKTLVGGRQDEVTLEYENFTLVGHIDGIAYPLPVNTSTPMLLEIKSMSQFEFDRWMRGGFEAFPKYAAQITCYLEATKLEQCLYIVKNRNNGYKYQEILTNKPMNILDIIDRLELALFSTEQEVLAPAEFDPTSIECKRCAYSKLCVPEPEKITGISKVVLDKACADWRLGKELMQSGQELIKQAEDAFWSYNVDLPKWRYNGLAISKSHVKYNNYDKKLLEATFEPVQLLPAVKVVEYDRIMVTDIEKKKESNDRGE